MVALIHVFAAQSDGGTLLGVAAIITAIGTFLAVLFAHFKKDRPGDGTNGLNADAKERIRLLKETIDDLERSLTTCRTERQALTAEAQLKDQVMTAEARLKDRHIGMLEQQLADARRRLEQEEGGR